MWGDACFTFSLCLVILKVIFSFSWLCENIRFIAASFCLLVFSWFVSHVNSGPTFLRILHQGSFTTAFHQAVHFISFYFGFASFCLLSKLSSCLISHNCYYFFSVPFFSFIFKLLSCLQWSCFFQSCLSDLFIKSSQLCPVKKYHRAKSN